MVAWPNREWLNVEDYLILDRNSREARYEYIDGLAYLLAGGTPQHSMISLNFASELNRQLRQRGERCRAYQSDARVRLSETRYVYPDVTVTCEGRDLTAEDSLRSPRVIIEVLSPGTESYDRSEKSDLYRACTSVEEIVLVRTSRRVVETYRRTPDNQWLLHIYRSDDEIELASLNLCIPIATIYEDVILPGDSLQ